MQNQLNPQYDINANLVHYIWNAIFTSHPRAQQQVQVVDKKTYSAAFNVSKRTGRNVWELVAPIIPEPKNKELLQGLEIALYQWMLTEPLKNTLPVNDVPFITGYQFNQNSSLSKAMNITVTGKRNNNNAVELTIPSLIPAKDFSAPAKTASLTIKIMAAAYSMVNGTKAESFLTEINIPYNDTALPLQNIILPVTAEQNVLMVVTMAIEYTVWKEETLQVVNNLRWMPAGIIWSGYN